MGIITAIAVYFVIWWLVLLMVLPWGNAPPSQVKKGHATSSPAKPRLGLKLLVTTGVSAIFFALFYWIQASDLITLRPA